MNHYRLLEKIFQNAEKQPDLPALYYRAGNFAECLSYYEVWLYTRQCRMHYISGREKRMGILGGNTWQWVCNAFGMIAAGCTTAFLDPAAPAKDLKEAVKKADLQMLVYDEEEEETAKEIGGCLPGLRLEKYCELSPAPQSGRTPAEDFAGPEGEILFFTSGTSKNSKVVVMPAEAMEGSMEASEALVCGKEGDTVILPVPFHHAFGFNMLNLFYRRRCPVFISSARRVAMDLPAARPSIVAAVPHMLEYLYSRKLLKPAYVKSVITAGSRLPMELAGNIEALGITAQNFYGSSEIPGGIGCSLSGSPADAVTLSAHVRVWITPEGEAVVFCPFHMSEYYGNPEETRAVLNGDAIYTGDAGYLDEKGCLHLLGRKRDMIVMENGEKIFCPDVDGEIKSFQGVRDGAVIYVQKKLVAVIEPERNADLQAIRKELEQYNLKQPYYRRISYPWFYSGPLPYTSSGKLKRRLLEESCTENPSVS